MSARSPRRLLSVLNLVGYAAVIVVNYLANALPLGGKTTAELSDGLPNLFVPAGITFAVWGVIYLSLAVFVVYGLVSSLRADEAAGGYLDRIGVLFLVSCAANVGWIFAWQFQLLSLSLLAMLVLLATLIVLYRRLDIGSRSTSSAEKFMVHLPFSIYLGWITIATIANVTALLVFYRWNAVSVPGEIWTLLMIAVGVFFAALMLFRRRDIFYALVVDWAALGIYLKRSVDHSGVSQTVAIGAMCALVLVSIGIIVQLGRRRVYA